MMKHISLRMSLLLLTIDAALVIIALQIATVMRIVLPYGSDIPSSRVLPIPVYIIALAAHHLIYTMQNIHSPRYAQTLLKELRVTFGAALLAWLIFLGALYLTYRDVSRLQIVYFIGVHLILIYLSRVMLRQAWASGDMFSNRPVLIIGGGAIAHDMYTLIQQQQASGLVPIGILTVDTTPPTANTLPHMGTLDQLEKVIADCNVREAVIALPRDTDINLTELVHRLQALPVNIRIVPQYTDLAFLQVQIEDFSGMPLLTLKEPVLTPYQRLLKRLFDLTFTVALLIPALPLMLVIALWIRLDSRGAVVFSQVRIGEGGKPFKIYKFRTMVDDAEYHPPTALPITDGAPMKQPDDPRVTQIGRFLRATSLDELPQLLNVLRGDMSWVGPRPELPERVEHYAAWQRKRFEVPQGITGWWQINGRADKPMHLHTEYDLFYIRNYSLWLDVQILWRTVWVVLSRRGAY